MTTKGSVTDSAADVPVVFSRLVCPTTLMVYTEDLARGTYQSQLLRTCKAADAGGYEAPEGHAAKQHAHHQEIPPHLNHEVQLFTLSDLPLLTSSSQLALLLKGTVGERTEPVERRQSPSNPWHGCTA